MFLKEDKQYEFLSRVNNRIVLPKKYIPGTDEAYKDREDLRESLQSYSKDIFEDKDWTTFLPTLKGNADLLPWHVNSIQHIASLRGTWG